MILNMYFGIVIDNDDPTLKSRVKVRILPEMTNANEDHLPWLEIFNAGSTNGNTLKHEPLEIGSSVWCLFTDQSLRTGWYFSGFFVNEKFDFGSIDMTISEFTIGDYKDLRLTRFEDGTVRFINVNTGVSGVYHNTGSYVVFDADGGITGYSKDKIHFYNDDNSLTLETGTSSNITIDSVAGNINLNGSANSLVKYLDLKLILDFLFLNLDTRMYIDPLSGVTGIVNPTHITTTFDTGLVPGPTSKLTTMEATKVKTG